MTNAHGVITASLAMVTGLAAQVQLTHVGTIDLTSTADPANPEFIGSAPAAIAWDGAVLYAAGANPTGSASDTGITRVVGALQGGQPSPAFGVLSANAQRGYSGLDVDASALAAAWDNGVIAPEGIQLFDAAGNLRWSRSARGSSGVSFDPGFGGVDAGTAWTQVGADRRALQDTTSGADVYTTLDGMVVQAPTAGTTWRDIDFAPNGDVYLRRGNDVVAHTRDGGNSVTGARFIQDNGANGDLVPTQNVAYADLGGGVVFWNDRASVAVGQPFADVVKCNAANGAPLAIDLGGFSAPDGDGAYDFSYDATTQTLAVLHCAARKVDVFAVSCSLGALTTTFAANNGQAGNMFDVTANSAPVTIDCFDVNLDVGVWDVEIYTTINGASHVGLEQLPSAWTRLTTAAVVTSLGANGPTPLPLTQPLGVTIGCGQRRGFYVTVSNGDSLNYATAPQPVGSDYVSDGVLTIHRGTGNVYPFSTSFGTTATDSRVFSGTVHYTTTSASCGESSVFGTGCYERPASYYEQMSATSFDLAGLALVATATATGYDVTTTPRAIAPVGASAVALALDDDEVVDTADPAVGGTLGLHVGSNCWIALGPGNSPVYLPSVETMLNNPATAIYAWTDLLPAQASGSGLGTVYYEESGAVATVTFDGVEGWNTGLTNDVQFVIDTATGDYSITFGAVSSANPEDWLIGYSTGGSSMDAGATDLSAGTLYVAAADQQPLSLDSDVPRVGASWTLQAENAALSPLVLFFFGDVMIHPGVDLAAVGAPGCAAYTNANLGAYVQPASNAASALSVPIPSNPALVGSTFTAQCTASTAQNTWGIATSNGLRVVVGS